MSEQQDQPQPRETAGEIARRLCAMLIHYEGGGRPLLQELRDHLQGIDEGEFEHEDSMATYGVGKEVLRRMLEKNIAALEALASDNMSPAHVRAVQQLPDLMDALIANEAHHERVARSCTTDDSVTRIMKGTKDHIPDMTDDIAKQVQHGMQMDETDPNRVDDMRSQFVRDVYVQKKCRESWEQAKPVAMELLAALGHEPDTGRGFR